MLRDSSTDELVRIPGLKKSTILDGIWIVSPICKQTRESSFQNQSLSYSRMTPYLRTLQTYLGNGAFGRNPTTLTSAQHRPIAETKPIIVTACCNRKFVRHLRNTRIFIGLILTNYLNCANNQGQSVHHLSSFLSAFIAIRSRAISMDR